MPLLYVYVCLLNMQRCTIHLLCVQVCACTMNGKNVLRAFFWCMHVGVHTCAMLHVFSFLVCVCVCEVMKGCTKYFCLWNFSHLSLLLFEFWAPFLFLIIDYSISISTVSVSFHTFPLLCKKKESTRRQRGGTIRCTATGFHLSFSILWGWPGAGSAAASIPVFPRASCPLKFFEMSPLQKMSMGPHSHPSSHVWP